MMSFALIFNAKICVIGFFLFTLVLIIALGAVITNENRYYIMEKLSFTAIDFETMTSLKTSACSIGLVQVVDNVIMRKFCSLIKPVPDDKDTTNTDIHGISMEMCDNAPTFLELWPTISPYIVDQTIVAHNAKFDYAVLMSLAEHYHLEISVKKVFDTMWIRNVSIEKACQEYGISIGAHHDALCDATACAELLLVSNGVTLPKTGDRKKNNGNFKNKDIDRDILVPLDDDQIENKETPFYRKKVLLTGNLDAFPQRKDIAAILWKCGADINSNLSKLTNIVIVGKGAGPSKLDKLQKLLSQGNPIKIMDESELLDILTKYKIRP